MSTNEQDTLILEADRAPIDNRQVTTSQLTNQSTSSQDKSQPTKKRRAHHKKVHSLAHKDKRPEEDEPPPSGESGSTPAVDSAVTPAPTSEVTIAPEVLRAIKSSLQDDLFRICQQACKEAMDIKDSQSSSSLASNSPAGNRSDVQQQSPDKTDPPVKPSCPDRRQHTPVNPRKRNHDGKDDRHYPWLTKAAKKHLSQQQLSTYPDEEGSQSGDTDDEEGDTEHFSTDEEQDPETDQEDRIARFFNAEDYQQLLTKCLSALDLKDKPQEEGATGATSGAIPPAVKGKYTHPGNTKWGNEDYFPKRLSTEKVFPFPIFFEEQLRAEWETPATTRRPHLQ